MITHDRSYRSVLLKTTTWSVPDRGISRITCVCLFFEICVLVSTPSVLFWKVTGCCYFSAWLPVCSVLNSLQLICCVVLRHPTDIGVLRIYFGGLRTAGAGTEQMGIDTLTKVKRICSAGVAETPCSGDVSSGNWRLDSWTGVQEGRKHAWMSSCDI